MGWATRYIEELLDGRTVSFRPHGNSMTPLICSGDLVRVVPFDETDPDPQVGDVVLCKVRGNQYLHLVTAIKGDQYQISNNKGYINGWCSRRQVYGRVIKVSRG
jgi:signal peptidase I